MSKHWAKLCFISAVLVVTAQAAHDGSKTAPVSGSIEAGWGWASTPTNGAAAGLSGSRFFVDQVNLKHHFDVNDKTSVTIHNAMAMNTNNNLNALLNTQNGVNYLAKDAQLSTGTFTFANQGAFLTHKCADGMWTSVGNLATPFGMESMSSRYDMATYFYSSSISRAHSAGWMYDLGVNLHFVDSIPGSLEFSILDGRGTSTLGNTVDGTNTPAVALRYSFALKNSDWSLTPVVSTYLGQWRGGPSNLGITAGLAYKMGALWTNFEFLYTSVKVAGNAGTLKDNQWSVVLEPGFDLGVAELSAKFEYLNNKDEGIDTTANSNMNLGLAVSKVYDDKYRIKLAYQHAAFSRKGAGFTAGPTQTPVNDVRLLFATAF